jgi:hypothetical protein
MIDSVSRQCHPSTITLTKHTHTRTTNPYLLTVLLLAKLPSITEPSWSPTQHSRLISSAMYRKAATRARSRLSCTAMAHSCWARDSTGNDCE